MTRTSLLKQQSKHSSIRIINVYRTFNETVLSATSEIKSYRTALEICCQLSSTKLKLLLSLRLSLAVLINLYNDEINS